MNAARHWLFWVVLLGVFLAGGVVGGLVSLRVAKSIVERGRGPDQFTQRHLERLADGLELSEEQRAKIKPIVDRTFETLHGYRNDSVAAMRAMEKQIMAELTPAQRESYNTMQQQARERWQRLMERRESEKAKRDLDRPDGPPPPPPPSGSRPPDSFGPGPGGPPPPPPDGDTPVAP